jgi:cobyric acid synthase
MNSDKTAQVIFQGKAVTNLGAKAYHVYKAQAMPVISFCIIKIARLVQLASQ